MSLKQLFPMHLFFMANPTEVLRLCYVVTIYKKFERFFAHPLLWSYILKMVRVWTIFPKMRPILACNCSRSFLQF